MPGVRLDSMTEPAIDCDQAADSSIIADLAWLLPIRVRFLGVAKVESSQERFDTNSTHLCARMRASIGFRPRISDTALSSTRPRVPVSLWMSSASRVAGVMSAEQRGGSEV